MLMKLTTGVNFNKILCKSFSCKCGMHSFFPITVRNFLAKEYMGKSFSLNVGEIDNRATLLSAIVLVPYMTLVPAVSMVFRSWFHHKTLNATVKKSLIILYEKRSSFLEQSLKNCRQWSQLQHLDDLTHPDHHATILEHRKISGIDFNKPFFCHSFF